MQLDAKDSHLNISTSLVPLMIGLRS